MVGPALGWASMNGGGLGKNGYGWWAGRQFCRQGASTAVWGVQSGGSLAARPHLLSTVEDDGDAF